METKTINEIADERFDELWASMKDQVRAARGERTGIDSRGGRHEMFPGRIRVGKGSLGSAMLYLSNGLAWEAGVDCDASTLRAVAANCLAAVLDIEEDEKNRKP